MPGCPANKLLQEKLLLLMDFLNITNSSINNKKFKLMITLVQHRKTHQQNKVLKSFSHKTYELPF